jgi:hypothetical protein
VSHFREIANKSHQEGFMLIEDLVQFDVSFCLECVVCLLEEEWVFLHFAVGFGLGWFC